MDYTEDENGFSEEPSSPYKPRQLPPDLPTSLDDRRHTPAIGEETEIYDAWQGKDPSLSTLSTWTDEEIRKANRSSSRIRCLPAP